jgi:acetylornithine/succinyldiaminopimelate/putrescine aminotransferase
MQRLDAPRLAREKGERLRGLLEALPGVRFVRGQGLLLAAELVEGIDAKAAYSALLDAGLVTNAVTGTALRLAPPLTVSDAEIDEAVAMIARVLADLMPTDRPEDPS